jgi:hypothetical protein
MSTIAQHALKEILQTQQVSSKKYSTGHVVRTTKYIENST